MGMKMLWEDPQASPRIYRGITWGPTGKEFMGLVITNHPDGTWHTNSGKYSTMADAMKAAEAEMREQLAAEHSFDD